MEYADLGVTRQAGRTASGIRVVVYTIPDRPIALTAVFNAGCRYDPIGRECLAHVTEHMIVAGTKDLPSKDKLAAYIEQLGGGIAAKTYPSTLMVRMAIGDASSFGRVIYLLNQVLTHSRYDEGVLQSELEAVRQELAVLQMDDSRYVDWLFEGRLLSRTELGGRLIDLEPAIDATTIDEVRQYAADRLMGGNMVIVAAGGITFEEVIAELDRGFELELGDRALEIPPMVTYQPPTERIVAKSHTSSDQTWLTYGFAGYDLAHPDVAILDVLLKVLGSGRASALARLLRYENNLVYSISAENVNDLGFGTWQISTATKSVNLRRVIELINGELSRAADGGITLGEVDQAKAIIVNSAPRRVETTRSFANFHEWPDLYDLPVFTRLPGWLNAVNDVTLSDVTRVAQDVFRPGTSVLALCGATSEAEELVLY